MTTHTATAQSFPNIAFIKYWGNRDELLRIPVNGSISMNLAGLETRTTVSFADHLTADKIIVNRKQLIESEGARVSRFLDRVRAIAKISSRAVVESENNFPTGAGIASSASAFAALALAASTAAGLSLDEAALSRLARTGSGSACRSIPGGFVEWIPGTDHESSFAHPIAVPGHWNIVDLIVIVQEGHKKTGSTEGHSLAGSSPLQAGRVFDAPRRLEICRQAILSRDFFTFAEIIELDSNLMHAVMITSNPPLLYWQPATLAIMQAITEWRANGLEAAYTIDAGPNVHVICPGTVLAEIKPLLEQIPGVIRVLQATPGGPTRLIPG
jgi:diphosphomevalonate decarboxylase